MPYVCTEHSKSYDKSEDLLAHLRDTVHAEINVASQCRCGAETSETYRGKMPDGVSNVLVLCENCLEAACTKRGWTITKPTEEEGEEEEDETPSPE